MKAGAVLRNPVFKKAACYVKRIEQQRPDADEAIISLEAEAKLPGLQSKISDHNQFNQCTRNLLADNPQTGIRSARHFWSLKRALPSNNARHQYDHSDLNQKVKDN